MNSFYRNVISYLKNVISIYVFKYIYRNAWVISDRIESGSDSGILFYNYLEKNHPNINIFFVLSKHSRDYKQLKKQKINVVPYGGLFHKQLIKYAQVEISSFFNFAPFDLSLLNRNNNLFRVFLGHGTSANDLSHHFINLPVDMIVIDNINAYNFYTSTRPHTKIKKDKLFFSSTPRNDLLNLYIIKNYDKKRDTIVIAPTWRQYLKQIIDNYGVNDGKFTNSEYIQSWLNVIHSNEIKKLSNKYNIVFLPHPELEEYLDKIKLPKYVKLKKYQELGTKNLYELALETKLFLTDYTSTAFDFAQLGSCVLYYQFDLYDIYNGQHTLRKGWFDYSRDGMGPVFYNKINLLKYIANDNYKNANNTYKYKNNVNKLNYKLTTNGAEEIYCEIIKRLNILK